MNRKKGTDGRFARTHGLTRTPEHRIWINMRSRCTNPQDENYKNYGGRGIGVCVRWIKFENFLVDMGPRPTPRHSLDRKNNDKGYYKRNCRWATRREQQNNLRSNRLITYKGKTQTLAAWAREVGKLSRTIKYRLDVLGLSVEEALTLPFQRKRKVHGTPDA